MVFSSEWAAFCHAFSLMRFPYKAGRLVSVFRVFSFFFLSEGRREDAVIIEAFLLRTIIDRDP